MIYLFSVARVCVYFFRKRAGKGGWRQKFRNLYLGKGPKEWGGRRGYFDFQRLERQEVRANQTKEVHVARCSIGVPNLSSGPPHTIRQIRRIDSPPKNLKKTSFRTTLQDICNIAVVLGTQDAGAPLHARLLIAYRHIGRSILVSTTPCNIVEEPMFRV